MVTDPIADLLTRLRNAQLAGHTSVLVPASKQKEALLELLAEEGFIASFSKEQDSNKKPALRVALRYDKMGLPVIKEIKRISKPGRRVYVGVENIPHNRGGLGVVVVSTSKGMLSDNVARKEKLGGELVCSVF